MDDNIEYERIESSLDEYRDTPTSPVFAAAVNRLERFALQGHPGAILSIAEIRAFVEPYLDREAAYFWYFIAHYQNGYETAFNNKDGTPDHYCGPIGDFRNGEAVWDLVETLGLRRVQELDAKAREWLAERNIKPGVDSGEWRPIKLMSDEPIAAYLSRP